jgi:hypothetical protein
VHTHVTSSCCVLLSLPSDVLQVVLGKLVRSPLTAVTDARHAGWTPATYSARSQGPLSHSTLATSLSHLIPLQYSRPHRAVSLCVPHCARCGSDSRFASLVVSHCVPEPAQRAHAAAEAAHTAHLDLVAEGLNETDAGAELSLATYHLDRDLAARSTAASLPTPHLHCESLQNILFTTLPAVLRQRP